VAEAHAERNGVQRVLVVDGAFDDRRPAYADDVEAVAPRQPVRGDRARLVERLRP
jgi:hypothetical protein